MVAAATDVLSLDELKRQFGLPLDHISEDSRITTVIQNAVDQFEADSGVKLVDDLVYFFAAPPSSPTDPLVIRARNVRQIGAVSYWLEGQTVKALPAGLAAADDLGRIEYGDDRVYIYHNDEWPAALANSNFVVQAILGQSEIRPKWRQAVIMASRHFYSGAESWPARSGYDRILKTISHPTSLLCESKRATNPYEGLPPTIDVRDRREFLRTVYREDIPVNEISNSNRALAHEQFAGEEAVMGSIGGDDYIAFQSHQRDYASGEERQFLRLVKGDAWNALPVVDVGVIPTAEQSVRLETSFYTNRPINNYLGFGRLSEDRIWINTLQLPVDPMPLTILHMKASV